MNAPAQISGVKDIVGLKIKEINDHLTTFFNNEFVLDHEYYLASPKVMVMRIYAVGVTGQAKDVSLPLRM